MGFLLVVITNQSGLARGYFSETDLQQMHNALQTELLGLGIQLSGIYYCPHHPDGVVPELATDCQCRKPRPGLLLQAARELHIDLEHSWFVGDILDDVEAGKLAGCRTVLVDLGTESAPEQAQRQPDFVARDTPHALRIVSAIEKLSSSVDLFVSATEINQSPVELFYQPPTWQQALPQKTRKAVDTSYD